MHGPYFPPKCTGERYLSECLHCQPGTSCCKMQDLHGVRISVAQVTANGYPQSLCQSEQENLWVCFSFLARSLKARHPHFGPEMQTWLILLISCYGLFTSQALCSPDGEGAAPRASLFVKPISPDFLFFTRYWPFPSLHSETLGLF